MRELIGTLALGSRYHLVSRLATGGMGDVWVARDALLERDVAIKVLRPGLVKSDGARLRFRAEARHAAGLAHPNIATVFDYGEDENLAYIVMELVDGPTLAMILARDGALSPARARSILGQCALGLMAAHARGVVHRDVKPANILITQAGRVRLTDFGIARTLDSTWTMSGEVLGTPYYLSPEQAQGKPATPASDIYALGVVGYEVLTGTRPFDHETPVATALAHINEPAPPLPAHVPGDLADVVVSCLAKNPSDRPEGAHRVAAALGFTVPDPPSPSAWQGDAAFVTSTPMASSAFHLDMVVNEVDDYWSGFGEQPHEIRQLDTLHEVLAGLAPRRNAGTFAVVSVQRPLPGVVASMTLHEDEGLTLLVRAEEADRLGLAYEFPLAWIILGVHRSIGTVGFAAALTTALTQAGIPVIAAPGRYHTSMFVPVAEADRALKVLRALSLAHQPDN